MNYRLDRKLLLAMVMFLSAAHLGILPVAAQDTATAVEAASLEEVMVTAQKRVQNIQDVGVAVTAIGKTGLAMIGHQDVSALATQVPSLQVEQIPSLTIFNIRGVSQNDFQDIQEAPIAFYDDEVYFSALGAISGQMFDLERVEVLRGPQGTLFGRNATGGLVQVITAKPTKDLQGFASVTAGSFSQLASEAAIGGPLTEAIRARVAMSTNHYDGYVRNLVGEDGPASRFYAGRAQLEADIGTQGRLLIKIEGLRNDHEVFATYTHASAGLDADGLGFALGPTEDFWGTCEGCDALGYRAGDNPLVTSLESPRYFDRTFWNGMIRYAQDLGFAELTSITDYQDLHKAYIEDSDGSPLTALSVNGLQDLKQFSEELRLAGDTERLNWVAGLYTLQVDSDFGGGGDLPGFGLAANFRGNQQTRSYAIFAQGEQKLSEVFSVILGARYGSDRKTYDYSVVENLTPADFTFNSSTFPHLARRTFHNYSGKIELDAKPNPDTLLYLSVNRGTKSGGFGVPVFNPEPDKIPFDQEALVNYEGGFKLALADGRVNFNGAMFHYDYRGYQAFSTDGLSQSITNKPAEVSGAEVEFSARAAAALDLNVFVTHLFTAEVNDIALPGGRVTDRTMPAAPEWSVGGAVSYTTQISTGSLLLSTNWKYDSEQYFTTFNAPVDLRPSAAIGNVRVSYTNNGSNWEAAFFVNNVTDKAYPVYGQDMSSLFGSAKYVYAPPRWYGGTLTYRFGTR